MTKRAAAAVIGLLFVGGVSAFSFRENLHGLLASRPNQLPTIDTAADSYQKAGGKTANAGLPKDIDGSLLVIEGIRKTINPEFREYTADQLYKSYSTPIDQPTKGTLLFFDYDDNGTMDYVATYLGDGLMTYASSSLATIEEKPIAYLRDEVLKDGGKMYYAQLNWAKIAAVHE